MSELSQLCAFVKGISSNLNSIASESVVWEKQFSETVSRIIDQVEGTSQTEIKECLAALGDTVVSVRNLRAALVQAVVIADSWVAINGGTDSSGVNTSQAALGLGNDIPVRRRRR